MYDIVCVGFTCLDVPVVGDIGKGVFEVDSTHVDKISMSAGGDAVNEVITAASLGMKAALVSYVGGDNNGKIILDTLKVKGVDTSGIEIFENESTQTAVPLIDKTGQRHFLFNSGCSPLYTGLNIDFKPFLNTKVMTIGSFYVAIKFDEIGAPVILKEAKEKGVITLADTCSDVIGMGAEHIAGALPFIDYFVPSYDEATILSGETDCAKIADFFIRMGATNIILKLGADGAYVKTPEREFTVPAFKDIKVIDTTGCGDNFVAGVAYGLYKDLELENAVRLGCAVAGINAGYVGGSGGLESIAVVREFLAERGIEINGL